MPTASAYPMTPIWYLASPFQEKFGIPRQPGLAPHARATLTLLPPFNVADSVRGLAAFSHVWLIFAFHGTAAQGWHPTVRPPRLGGNARVGVFASRSTFRPNPLGLSVAKLVHVETELGVTLTFSGLDLLNGTPILDLKPYIPFVDSQPDALGGFVAGTPPTLPVIWTAQARADVLPFAAEYPHLPALIDEVLAQDPRPAYQQDPTRHYGVKLYSCNVRFVVTEKGATVLAVEAAVPICQSAPQ